MVPITNRSGFYLSLPSIREVKETFYRFASLFQPPPPETLEIQLNNESIIWIGELDGVFDYSTKPYPEIEVQIGNGSSIVVAKTWLSDISRIGFPDQFVLNSEVFSKALTTENEQFALIETLNEALGENREETPTWTQIWSYRVKSYLINELMHKFKDDFDLNPIIKPEGYTTSKIQLDTENAMLDCLVEGKIQYASDENNDILDFRAQFVAHLIYSKQEQILKTNITIDRQKGLGAE